MLEQLDTVAYVSFDPQMIAADALRQVQTQIAAAGPVISRDATRHTASRHDGRGDTRPSPTGGLDATVALNAEGCVPACIPYRLPQQPAVTDRRR